MIKTTVICMCIPAVIFSSHNFCSAAGHILAVVKYTQLLIETAVMSLVFISMFLC